MGSRAGPDLHGSLVEPLAPGPVGEYLEVVDVDPASRASYDPVNLDDPMLLAQGALCLHRTFLSIV